MLLVMVLLVLLISCLNFYVFVCVVLSAVILTNNYSYVKGQQLLVILLSN